MIHYIITDMTEALNYLLYGLLAGVFFAVARMFMNRRRRKCGKEPLKVVAPTCLVAFSTVILCITFLSRELGSRPRTIDMQLFGTWGRTGKTHALVMENIILFVPYGFLMAWNLEKVRRFLPAFFTGLLSSLAIESLQLLTGRGYFQIDDVCTNTLGMLLGVGAWTVGAGIFNRLKSGKETHANVRSDCIDG